MVAEHLAGQREDRGRDEGAGAHGGERGERALARVAAHAAGEDGGQHERQGPAAGDVLGGRGEVEQHPGGEAHGDTDLGAAHERGGHDHQQRQVGHHAVDGHHRQHGDLRHDGEDDHRREHEVR